MKVEVDSLMRQLLTESRRARDPSLVPEDLRCKSPVSGPVTQLPEPLGDRHLLDEALRQRAANRHFEDVPISLAAAATVLAAADRADLADWASERAANVPLILYLLAWRVEGLPSAIYRYDGSAHELMKIGPTPTNAVDRLLRQPEFGSAAAFVEVAGNLAAALARHGSHGHRMLLVRAGAAAHRAWLAALSVGLAGCIFEGLLPIPFRAATGTNGYTSARLVSFAVGRPAKSDDQQHQDSVNPDF
jgi:Nitroreductase family